MAKKRRKRGRRFPLLVYVPVGQRLGNLGLLLALAGLALWGFAPRMFGPPIGAFPWRHLLLLFPLVGGFLFVYGLATRHLAYVQCFPTHFRIQTPFYPLVVSYRRVMGTRPVQVAKLFDWEKDKRARSWPKRYWGMTAMAVDLKSFPMDPRWLRLWLDPHLFLPDGIGFVFLVEDWMDLSQEFNGFLAAYRDRKSGRRGARR